MFCVRIHIGRIEETAIRTKVALPTNFPYPGSLRPLSGRVTDDANAGFTGPISDAAAKPAASSPARFRQRFLPKFGKPPIAILLGEVFHGVEADEE
jgi:hypothetical protein